MSMNAVFVLSLVVASTATPLLTPRQSAAPKVGLLEAFGGPKVRGVKGAKKPDMHREHYENEALKCDLTVQVDSHTDKHANCPTECPYFAQNRKDTEHCTFVCAPAEDCAKWNPNKPIPDLVKNSRTCRGPKADFCKVPQLDGTDTCITCQTGFALHMEDGQCYFQYWTVLFIFTALVVALVVVFVVWFVDFCRRETINGDEVVRAQEFRSRSKILMPKSAEHPQRTVYPIDTNLCKKEIAGAGMLLHFNFQAFLIFWPLVIAIVWTVLACFHNELFILGTRKFGTPRSNCILVAWGYETQQRLMWTKVLFLVITYIFSFITFLLFGIRQARIYQELDCRQKTMKDFAVELKGLPGIAGDYKVGGKFAEELLKKCVADATKKTVVGVSIAWNFQDKQDEIAKGVRDDQHDRQVEMGMASPEPEDTEPPASMGPLHKQIYNKEKTLFGPDPEEPEEMPMRELLAELKSSESAFVVFERESDKADALELASTEGIVFKYNDEDYALTLEELECEPATINWHNFGDSGFNAMLGRFFLGFFKVYLPALAVWFFVFYVPYAVSLYNFNYDNGAELPGIYSIVFTMVVVGGNATMYVVCDICCDVIGFRYKDTKQVVYMLFYLFACMLNVLLDMVVTYYTALKIMVGLDFRTYDGTRLADIDVFSVQFETYAMQRSLGENTYRYAFPSTMLVPFLIEPVITILIPYQIGKLIIRTHKEVTGVCAEAYIAAFDFDMGRYADILLNVFLGILIFFFPGGYIWTLFFGMFISHIVIYLFDHWRVINVIPAVKIVSRQVDFWAQLTLAGCCAMILQCLVFKMNCESYAGYCLKTYALIGSCSLAFIAHFVVHCLLVIYLVPALGEDPNMEDMSPDTTYAEMAKDEASSWFSVNPVHCLRSKFVQKDSPHCRFVSVGKEHLLQENTKINCFFQDEPAPSQDFDHFNWGDVAAGSWTMIKSLPSALTTPGRLDMGEQDKKA